MDDEIASDVREHGWTTATVSDHEPPFAYTIGLMETYRHPEFIAFGMEPGNASAMFARLVDDLVAGRSYAAPGVYTVPAGGQDRRIAIRRVHPTQHPLYLGFAMGFLTNVGRIGELEAVQVFWPDRQGKFPFEVGCEEGSYRCQPRLDIGLTPSEVKEFRRRWE